MTEENSIAPSQFTGLPSENGENWYRHFDYYCKYKGYNNAKILALFKLLLKDNAALWLDSQSPDVSSDLTSLKLAFAERYYTPEIMRYKSAKEIFLRKQKEDEQVDDYIASMKKLAKTIDADDKMLRYAILNGLKSELIGFVIQRQPQTIQELLQAARLAEFTCPTLKDTDSLLSKQIVNVQEQLKDMKTKWDEMLTSSASSSMERNTLHSASLPGRQKVNITNELSDTNNNYSHPSNQPPHTPHIYFNSNRGRYHEKPQQRQFTASMSDRCSRCARTSHVISDYCPAVNKHCNLCGLRGHFSAVCQTVTRPQPQTSSYSSRQL